MIQCLVQGKGQKPAPPRPPTEIAGLNTVLKPQFAAVIDDQIAHGLGIVDGCPERHLDY